MGVVDDYKIEQAVQAALAESADARAAAMLRIASDPKGTKARLEELTTAIQASNDAREAAEKIAEKVAADREAAETALATVRDERAAFDRHVAENERNLKLRECNLLPREQAFTQRDLALDKREAALQARIAEHVSLMRRLRAHLEEFVE